MDDVRIVTEEIDLCITPTDNEYLVEMVSEEGHNMEMYLTREQLKELIKGLTDLL